MILLLLLLLLLYGINSVNSKNNSNIIYVVDDRVKSNRYIFHFMQLCGLCQKDNLMQLSGLVSDCNCDFNTVNHAVKSYFSLILEKLTSTTYFRYFRVDLDSPCPFWNEFGQCNMEGCSVCECDEREIPKTWLDDYIKPNIDLWEEYNNIDNIDSSTTGAWIGDGKDHNDRFSSLLPNSVPYGYLQYLEETEDDDSDMLDWTDMVEDTCGYKKKVPSLYLFTFYIICIYISREGDMLIYYRIQRDLRVTLVLQLIVYGKVFNRKIVLVDWMIPV